MLTVSLFAALSSTLLSVQGATITELVQQRASTLGRTVEALRANPSWMSDPAGQYTLFVANDAALAAANVPQGSLGKVLINQALDYNTATYYQILQDTVSDTIMVYDNYTPGTRPDPGKSFTCTHGDNIAHWDINRNPLPLWYWRGPHCRTSQGRQWLALYFDCPNCSSQAYF